MRLLNQITNKAYQKYSVTTENGIVFDLTLRFLPTQQAWVIDVIYNDFATYNLALNINLNCLIAFKNILPFGLMCVSNFGGDPQAIDDFATGNAKLYTLNRDDIQSIDKTYFGE